MKIEGRLVHGQAQQGRELGSDGSPRLQLPMKPLVVHGRYLFQHLVQEQGQVEGFQGRVVAYNTVP